MAPKPILDAIVLLIIIIGVIGFSIYLHRYTPPAQREILYTDLHGNTNKSLSLYKLSAYIARKIYDLAVLQDERCPITHEKFILGNVAIMPCGHIYSKSALHTYFYTKNDKKCLICKYDGIPIYL
jgi:hypothetical protein